MAEETEGNGSSGDGVDRDDLASEDASATAPAPEDGDVEPDRPVFGVVDGEADDAHEDAEAGKRSEGFEGFEEPARRLISSMESFLGGVFSGATEAVDRMTAKEPGGTGGGRADRTADPAEFIDSVEGWIGDFFRGGPVGKAAAGFGRAAAGSALRSASKPDDVWASATAEHNHGDASRECRYCPFCQTLAAVRSTRPELYEQIGDTAKRLVDLVRQAAEQSERRRPWR